MGINIGGIDIAQSALDAEFKVTVLEKIVEKMLNKMGGTSIISEVELNEIRENAFKELQIKYPNAGLTINK